MKPKLEYCSQGSSVKELQSKLNELLPHALPKLAVDGKYFEKTVARVKEFQRSRGLVADGIVGAQTWAALEGAPPKPGAPKPPGPPPSSKEKPKESAQDKILAGLKVHHGARMYCSRAIGSSCLLLNDPSRPATVEDCAPYVNIVPFTHCRSPKNPALKNDVMDPDTFAVGFDDPEQLGGGLWYTGEKVPMKPAKLGPCLLVIEYPWGPSKCLKEEADVPLSQRKLIDKTAVLCCAYGGKIRFYF